MARLPLTAQEQHIHLEQCSADLNEAWRIGQALRDDRDNTLAGVAFKYLLIAYARPFKEARAASQKGYRLGRSVVPAEHRAMHDRLLAARDQVFAHSDLTVREATLYVAAYGDKKIASIVQNVVHGTEEFKNLDSIIALIEGTLDQLYLRIEKSEQALPVSV